MDIWLINDSFLKWLKSVISIGNSLISMSNSLDRGLTSTYEHYFVIAVGKSLEWGNEYKTYNKEKFQIFNQYKLALPEAKLVRNMREHDVSYLKGEGHKQNKFIKSIKINDSSMNASVDGTSTIICDEGYLISGRLNVQKTIQEAEKTLSQIQGL